MSILKSNSKVVLSLEILVVAAFIVMCTLKINSNTAIDPLKKDELNSMVNGLKATSFEKGFSKYVEYYSTDGKITNKEFSNLSELHENYLIAKSINNEDVFHAEITNNFSSQIESNEKKFHVTIIIMNIFIIIISIGALIFMFRNLNRALATK